MNGWIKFHRKILDWEWYTDTNTKCLFIHLLLIANHEERKWKGITINPGQCVTGRNSLAKQTGLSVRQIRTSINHLKTTSEIAIKTTNRFSIITLLNWDKYQMDEEKRPSKRPAKRPATDQQPTTNKNNKKDKNNTVSKKSLKYIETNKDNLITELQNKYPDKNSEKAINNFIEQCKIKDYKYKDYWLALCKWIREDKFNEYKIDKQEQLFLEEIRKSKESENIN